MEAETGRSLNFPARASRGIEKTGASFLRKRSKPGKTRRRGSDHRSLKRKTWKKK